MKVHTRFQLKRMKFSFSNQFLNKLNDYKIAKLLISVTSSTNPYALFCDILSHMVLETRKPNNPSFLDMSRTRVGRQSLSNRIGSISKRLKFEWLSTPFTPSTLRTKLKSTFYSYFTQLSVSQHPRLF